ncbi:putative glucose-methanol-choline oxidoreductase family of flavoenzyme [Vibrio nigripulchritudo SOn1]|uniref:Glucose-methanol-choline oxidoreductase family of flavoenzyme n=1 Tax=Vibrio nigripulchritudo SOn1 TaxID=1238450 RepID=A0AAV2VSS1_9VIBR|nr:GMC family oxidoreductase [Vibrio nigripulchritudo]CCO47483.1 putative glucose-methanol-choline oxidoreductase family of flavoenzyme [Vibrio nigripulchritudo SOn1]
MDSTYDYIIVGGGAAGCVVAARLAKESNAKVLLLEAGHSHHHPLLDMPPGIFKMINGSKFMSYHHTTPQDHLGGRVHDIPQGNVLGGGSSVNAQVYMRGRPADYDEWNEILKNNQKKASWSWEDILPIFKTMEGNNRLNDDYHGAEGPLLVSDPGYITPMSRWFVQSMQEIGEPYNHDFNGESQRGAGFYQFMNRDGRRSSSAYAYIEPLQKLANLTVVLNAKVEKVVIEEGVAKSVLFKNAAGQSIETCANEEIILSAGSLITPKLLMLSGVGEKEELKTHGIDCKADLPGVGKNLIDHPEVPVVGIANGPYGYARQGKGWRMMRNGIQFKLFGSGPILSAGVEAGAFVNPKDRTETPTIQAFCVPAVYLDRDILDTVDIDTYGLTVTTVVIKPKSRGWVKLASSNPEDMPLVSPNLLSEKEDMDEMIAAQRFFVRAFQEGPLSQRIKQVAVPDPNDLTDEAIALHCQKTVKTNYHPSGTCKMGADDDPLAVLDAKLCVRGVEKLRVCDLSAMPNINAGNTNAPAMMIGYRCTEFILNND